MRRANYENIKKAKERGRVFTFEQIEDVVNLVVEKQRPDGDFSDDECNLWLLIVIMLGIDTNDFN